MSRERLATAYDQLAEAYAQVAHELRALDSSPRGDTSPRPRAAASLTEEQFQAVVQQTGGTTPPPDLQRRIDSAQGKANARDTYPECPAHREPWSDGNYGPYCRSKSDEPKWSNDKGYCTIRPSSAGAWIKQHPAIAAAPAADVDDIPF
jgi:hypothetical protein